MNPDFADGDKQLHHALELFPNTEIRCLLNAETVRNVYSESRAVLMRKLSTRQHEIVELGRCFGAGSGAERNTEVEIVLIKVKAEEKKSSFEFDLSGMTGDEKHFTIGDVKSGQVEIGGLANSLVHRYNLIKQLGAQMNELQAKMRFYAKGLLDDEGRRTISQCSSMGYTEFIAAIRASAWNNLFSDTEVANTMTTKVKSDFQSSQEAHALDMAFNENNILELILMLLGSAKDIRKNSIQEAFDTLTKYYDENRLVVEGWKTNKAWKVNRKVILPALDWYNVSNLKKYKSDKVPSLSSSFQDKVRDIEKALCFIAGIQWDKIKEETLGYDYWVMKDCFFNTWYESYFFKYKIFDILPAMNDRDSQTTHSLLTHVNA